MCTEQSISRNDTILQSFRQVIEQCQFNRIVWILQPELVLHVVDIISHLALFTVFLLLTWPEGVTRTVLSLLPCGRELRLVDGRDCWLVDWSNCWLVAWKDCWLVYWRDCWLFDIRDCWLVDGRDCWLVDWRGCLAC